MKELRPEEQGKEACLGSHNPGRSPTCVPSLSLPLLTPCTQSSHPLRSLVSSALRLCPKWLCDHEVAADTMFPSPRRGFLRFPAPQNLSRSQTPPSALSCHLRKRGVLASPLIGCVMENRTVRLSQPPFTHPYTRGTSWEQVSEVPGRYIVG